jgi:anhydro-N-acetylmuramic acid kinase
MPNMYGIANFTYLISNMNPEEVFVTDTGTGNTLIGCIYQTILSLENHKDGNVKTWHCKSIAFRGFSK